MKFAEAMRAKQHDAFASVQDKYETLLTEFDRQFGIEFNPTAGVVSSVLSQEVIKVVTMRDHPASGLMLYDSVN